MNLREQKSLHHKPNPKNKDKYAKNSQNTNKNLANLMIQKLLIGEYVGILDYAYSSNPSFFEGQIVDETRGTFLIRLNDKKIRCIPKNRAHFIIKDTASNQHYCIQGKLYNGRAEERTKNEIRKLW